MAYEFDAGKYRQASDHQQTWGERLISELHLAGSERVLDLGCGEGRLTAMLASQTPHGYVLGIDASQNMIDMARRSHTADNLEFRLVDINEMDFQEEFDVIFSNATLHWVNDHRRMLARVHKALSPCGVMRFSFAGEGNCVGFFEVVRRTMEEEPFATCFRGFQWPWFMPSTDEYEGLMAASEFAEARVWQENADTVFQTAAALTGWIDQPSLVPFLVCLQGPDRRRFRDVVVQRMLERTGQADGTYLETFRRINVRAVKSPGGNT